MQNSIFTLKDFEAICPYEHWHLTSGFNEDIVLQFLLDLEFVAERVRCKELDKNEIFILINQDFTISIKKFLQNYNKTLGQQFPLRFILNFLIECGVAKTQFFAIIVAPRTHINYFKLVCDVKHINIHNLDDNLKDYRFLDLLPEFYKSVSEYINELREKQSVKLIQSLTY